MSDFFITTIVDPNIRHIIQMMSLQWLVLVMRVSAYCDGKAVQLGEAIEARRNQS